MNSVSELYYTKTHLDEFVLCQPAGLTLLFTQEKSLVFTWETTETTTAQVKQIPLDNYTQATSADVFSDEFQKDILYLNFDDKNGTICFLTMKLSHNTDENSICKWHDLSKFYAKDLTIRIEDCATQKTDNNSFCKNGVNTLLLDLSSPFPQPNFLLPTKRKQLQDFDPNGPIHLVPKFLNNQ